jgi:hypothetical protein
VFAEQAPFRQEQGRVDRQHEGDDPSWAEPGQKTAGRFRRRDRKDRYRGHEVREARDLKPGEEERVANRVGRDLLRDQRRGGERGHKLLP